MPSQLQKNVFILSGYDRMQRINDLTGSEFLSILRGKLGHNELVNIADMVYEDPECTKSFERVMHQLKWKVHCGVLRCRNVDESDYRLNYTLSAMKLFKEQWDNICVIDTEARSKLLKIVGVTDTLTRTNRDELLKRALYSENLWKFIHHDRCIHVKYMKKYYPHIDETEEQRISRIYEARTKGKKFYRGYLNTSRFDLLDERFFY